MGLYAFIPVLEAIVGPQIAEDPVELEPAQKTMVLERSNHHD
jgi:hypothetical protein